MIWTIIVAIAALLTGYWLGAKKLFYFDWLTSRRVLIIAIILLILFLVLRLLHKSGFFPEVVAGAFMASLYSFIAGFLFGTARWQYKSKSKMGAINYLNRSFVTDILPNLVALTLIITGVMRSALFNDQAITPIRVSSGLSFIGFGIVGLSLRLIPEFRQKGFTLLDRSIPWADFVSFCWVGEYILELEFEYNETLKTYRTIIPMEDRAKLEDILKKKLIQKLEKESSNGTT